MRKFLLLLIFVSLIVNSETSISQSQELPQNGLIAFVLEVDGNADIYTIQPDGTNLQQLTFTEGYEQSPIWSPDGSRIAYIYEWQLYIMNADGSDNTQIDIGDRTLRNHIDWSPDGNMIAFDDWNNAGWDDIFVLDLNTMDIMNLTNLQGGLIQGPEWSPDGSQIAFVWNGDNPIPMAVEGDPRLDIYIIDVDGSNLTQIGDLNALGLGSLSWRSDGVIFCSLGFYDSAIFAVHIEDGSIEMFTDYDSSYANVSPDEQKIVYGESGQLAVMDADGTNSVIITEAGGFNPDWQPIIVEEQDDD